MATPHASPPASPSAKWLGKCPPLLTHAQAIEAFPKVAAHIQENYSGDTQLYNAMIQGLAEYPNDVFGGGALEHIDDDRFNDDGSDSTDPTAEGYTPSSDVTHPAFHDDIYRFMEWMEMFAERMPNKDLALKCFNVTKVFNFTSDAEIMKMIA